MFQQEYDSKLRSAEDSYLQGEFEVFMYYSLRNTAG